MKKLLLIIQREYLTRVKSRSFIVGTLLTPIAFGAFFAVQIWMAGYNGDEKKHIIVMDEGGFLQNQGLADRQGLQFTIAPKGALLDSLKSAVRQKKYDGVLRLPALANFSVKKQTIFYYSDDPLSPDVESTVKNRIERIIRDFKIDSSRLDRAAIENLDTNISIDPEPIDDSEDTAGRLSSGVAMGISMFMGIIMYMLVLIWGSIVMRSVMEEKTSRIVEVIMSSVKPFELMLGKIIGSAGVGLTQLILWAVLNMVIFMGVQAFMGADADTMQAVASQTNMPGGMSPGMNAEMEDTTTMLVSELSRQNWPYIILMALLFFLGGYFLYASMFAAVGSAVGDDMSDGQSLTFPIMIPIIIAFLLMVMVVVRTPHSPLAVFASMFPLFSPIVMPGRMAFDPPVWQVVVSILLLIATALLFVWISGRIYRVGILMYGKKVTVKEIWKWMFYKG